MLFHVWNFVVACCFFVVSHKWAVRFFLVPVVEFSESGFVYLSLFLESRVHGFLVGSQFGFLFWVVREC